MWSGRIIPLFNRLHESSQVYKPFAADRAVESRTYDPSNSLFPNDPEEMLLPLPEDICFGTGIRDGSIVHVAYQWNPPIVCNKRGEPCVSEADKADKLEELRGETNKWLKHYGDDVAAWFVVSPFPIELLSDRIMQVIVHLGNKPGAFLEAVAEPTTLCSAAILQAEGLSTGDEGSLLLFPPYMCETSADSEDQRKQHISDRMKKLIKRMNDVPSDYLEYFSVRVSSEMIDDIKAFKEDLKKRPKKIKIKTIQQMGWLEELVRPGIRYEGTFKAPDDQALWRMKSKKISVRDRMITVPWGEVTRRYRDARWWIKEANSGAKKEGAAREGLLEDSYDVLQPLPRYALLVRDPDLPVVIGVIPQRMLFQVIMRLRSSGVLTKDESDVGVGSVQRICEVLRGSRSNIWHIEQLPSQITFTERASEKPGSPTILECSFIESDLRIVAACPYEWRYADEKSMHKYFKGLRHNLAQLKVPRLRVGEQLHLHFPEDESIRKWLRRLYALTLFEQGNPRRSLKAVLEFEKGSTPGNGNKEIDYLNRFATEVGIDINKVQELVTDFVVGQNNSSFHLNRLLKRWPDINEVLWGLRDEMENSDEKGAFKKCETWLRDTINEFGEPIVRSKEAIEIHAPPLLRIFFSHSAHPEATEKDRIDQIKGVLANYSESIVEGQFSAGLSTEELSRGRIRLCSVLVSFFWPRDEYMNKNGEHAPPEWVAHEESFAMGLGLRIIRIREKSVRNPRYEYDRPAIDFDRNDSHSWEKAKKKLAKELCEFVLREAQKFVHH